MHCGWISLIHPAGTSRVDQIYIYLYINSQSGHNIPTSKIELTGEAWSWDSGDKSWACGLQTVLRYFARAFWNQTCNTRFERPVFCESCFKSFASGLWFIAKYAFIALSWWCLNDVRMRLGLLSPLCWPRWLSASEIVKPKNDTSIVRGCKTNWS